MALRLEQELVGERALAMIDVGNDAEIANQFRRGHRPRRGSSFVGYRGTS